MARYWGRGRVIELVATSPPICVCSFICREKYNAHIKNAPLIIGLGFIMRVTLISMLLFFLRCRPFSKQKKKDAGYRILVSFFVSFWHETDSRLNITDQSGSLIFRDYKLLKCLIYFCFCVFPIFSKYKIVN